MTDKGVALAPSPEEIEIDLLLEGTYQYCGADFRGYARDSVRPRLRAIMREQNCKTVSALQELVFHDQRVREAFLRAMSMRAGPLFLEAGYMRSLRDTLPALLRSYANPKIWVAECSAAEDVFGLAALLADEGLYDRTMIFATGSNEALLHEAKEGAFSADRLGDYDAAFRLSGACASLEKYCSLHEERCQFAPALRSNITWAQYSLVSDTSFNEFQFILCHGRISEFASPLRRRVLGLFHESLASFGILGTEVVSELTCPPFSLRYQALRPEYGLFRRTQ